MLNDIDTLCSFWRGQGALGVICLWVLLVGCLIGWLVSSWILLAFCLFVLCCCLFVVWRVCCAGGGAGIKVSWLIRCI